MDLINRAKQILSDCMNVKKNEKVLIVTDDTRFDLGNTFYIAAQELEGESMLMVMSPREVSGEEPPVTVAEAMRNAEVVICITDKSLTHTNARILAANSGARIATMPGIREEMFYNGAMTADYVKVEALTEKVAVLLTKARTARIEKDGFVMNFNLEGRSGISSTGVYKLPGQSGNLPSGEAYIAPLENSTWGETVIDGSMVGIGKLESTLHLTVKDGKLCGISGEKSEKLEILLRNDRNAILCELGIGTNEKAILRGIILEDEKVYGTVHIAFGSNTSFGGLNKADCHMDGVILNPTFYLDDILVIENGVFLV